MKRFPSSINKTTVILVILIILCSISPVIRLKNRFGWGMETITLTTTYRKNLLDSNRPEGMQASLDEDFTKLLTLKEYRETENGTGYYTFYIKEIPQRLYVTTPGRRESVMRPKDVPIRLPLSGSGAAGENGPLFDIPEMEMKKRRQGLVDITIHFPGSMTAIPIDVKLKIDDEVLSPQDRGSSFFSFSPAKGFEPESFQFLYHGPEDQDISQLPGRAVLLIEQYGIWKKEREFTVTCEEEDLEIIVK